MNYYHASNWQKDFVKGETISFSRDINGMFGRGLYLSNRVELSYLKCSVFVLDNTSCYCRKLCGNKQYTWYLADKVTYTVDKVEKLNKTQFSQRFHIRQQELPNETFFNVINLI